MTDHVVALAKWKEVELFTACLLLCIEVHNTASAAERWKCAHWSLNTKTQEIKIENTQLSSVF